MVAKVVPLQAMALILRIELYHIEPVVYRTIVVPSRIPLPKLHVSVLRAMGWEGGHLHEFIINGVRYGEPDPDFADTTLKDERKVRLDKVLGAARQFEYLYDFGDNWEHRISLIEGVAFKGPLDRPWCLEGANACPPEDVGGEPGYMEFLHAVSDPTHPDHEHMVGWHGGPFDPTAFDLQEVNERLMEIKI